MEPAEVEVIPELKQIIGALLYASKTPVTAGDIRKTLQQVAETGTGAVKDFGEVSEADVRAALAQLKHDLETNHVGIHMAEVANGFRLQNDASCGLWVRQMLNKGKDSRLSKPALETLAIIAYRQPIMRSEIEAVRGVQVDQVMRTLLDMQLIRIVGRSELPGRPWLFGTTQKFLEYFGLRNVQDLPGIEELKRMVEEQEKAKAEAAQAAVQQELGEEKEDGEDGEGGEVEEDEEDQKDAEDEEEEEVDEDEKEEEDEEEEEDEFDEEDEDDEDDEDEEEEDEDDEKED